MNEIQNRRSTRKYQDKPVEQEKLLQVLEAARWAPSGSNSQPWKFIVVESPEIKAKIAKVDHNQQWMLSAPVFIVCVADTRCRSSISWEGEIYLDEDSPQQELKHVIRDTAVAVENLLLEAEHIGLATCWTAWFVQKDIRPILGIPEDRYVCGVVTLGYGNETPTIRPRREMQEIVYRERWGES